MLRIRKPLLIVLAVVLAAAMSACKRGDTGTVGDLQDQTLPRKLTLRITGAHTFELNETRNLRVLIRKATGSNAQMSVASVSTSEFYPAPNGWLAQPEAAIVGLYDGDGTYTLPAGRGRVPTTGPTVPDDPSAQGKLSVVQTTFDRFDKPGSAQRYDYALEPCVVVLNDDGKTGSAKCPKLANHDGQTISMEMSWGEP